MSEVKRQVSRRPQFNKEWFVRVNRVPFVLLFAFIAVLFTFSPALQAQSIYGSISGKVLDSSGAVIPGATVVAKSIETGLSRQTETDATGFYRIPSLSVGNYSIEYSAKGFEKIIRAPIAVDSAVDRSIEITLKPGITQELITVSEQAPLIEATQAQISKGVDSSRIMELPGLNSLNGLALLMPGTANNNNGRPGSGFVVNGGRTRSNNFTIDGANNNDQSLSTPRQNLPPEHIQQFRIITNTFSAEYGRNSGSFVNQITRSGSNELHGGARWTWQGNGLDSLTTSQQRTFNSNKTNGLSDYLALRKSRAVIVDNLGLVNVGGPIKKDHSFFYVGYDRQWYRTTAVPTTIAMSPQGYNLLQANKSLFADGTVDYLQKTFLIANDTTPRGSITVPTSAGNLVLPLQQYNRGLTGALSYGRNYWRWMAKTDHKLTERDNLSVRYLIDDYADPGSPSAIPGNEVGQNSRNQSFTLNEVHVFSPTTVNEFRATYGRRALHFPQNLPPYLYIVGFNSVGDYNYPQFRVDNLYEFMDSVSSTRGRHTIKMGGNLLRYQLNSFFAANYTGYIRYPSLTDYLSDRNAQFQQYAGQAYLPARTTEIGAYFQDDYRVAQNLTLNLGLRYEYTGAPFGYFSNAKPDITNFGPRVGFAWSPRANGGLLGKLLGGDRTAIRGGYSLAYDQVFQNILLNVAKNYPRGVNISQSPVTGQRVWDINSAIRKNVPQPEDYAKLGGNPDLLPMRVAYSNRRIMQPYSQQMSLGIERQLFSNYAVKLFYVGTHGLHLVREVETNVGFNAAAVNNNPAVYAGIMPSLKPVVDSKGNVTGYRKDPTKGSITSVEPIASSTYHSLQATLEKRFANGLQFELNYTYSSFINTGDDILGGQINSTVPAVPFAWSLDRGRSAFDQPHRFVANYVYLLPNIRDGKGVFGRVLGGWELSGVTTIAQGTPYTILNAENALGILPGAVSTVEGSQRASVLLGGTRPLPSSKAVPQSQWYFVNNTTNSGIIGTAGRNTERVGRTVNFDTALAKRIRTIGERQSLQLRWELFNLLNHRNFSALPPVYTVSSDTDPARFMNLGQANVSGRTMLFSLRYQF